MEILLTDQYKKIDQLKTNQHLKMLMLGIRCFGAFYDASEDLLKKHKSKNPTINSKLKKYRDDLEEKYNFKIDDFCIPATREISKSCGFHEDDNYVADLIFDYGNGDLDIDSLIENLKWYVSES